jgi:cation diffusion facilitator family transporter
VSHKTKAAVYKALAANVGIAAAKFAGAAVTGSVSMLSEGVHSLVDSGNQVLLLLGMRLAERVPDERHPFGYGREAYFWAFLVAVLIFGIGSLVSIGEGVERVLHPVPVERAVIASVGGVGIGAHHVVLVILAVSMALEGWSLAGAAAALRGQGRGLLDAVLATKDPAVAVVFAEDAAAVVGLGVAFVGVGLSYVFDNTLFDGLASVGVGLVLMATSVFLMIETKGLLIGESASPEAREAIAAIVADMPGVDTVNEIVTMHHGPDDLLVCVSLDFKDKLTSRQVEAVVSAIDREVKEAVPAVSKVFVEAQSHASHVAILGEGGGDGRVAAA